MKLGLARARLGLASGQGSRHVDRCLTRTVAERINASGNLSVALQMNGDLPEALRHARATLATVRKARGAGAEAAMMFAMMSLATVYIELRDPAGLPLLNQVVLTAARRRMQGDDHVETLGTICNLAIMHSRMATAARSLEVLLDHPLPALPYYALGSSAPLVLAVVSGINNLNPRN